MSSGHGVAITTVLRNRMGSPDHHHARVPLHGGGVYPGAKLIADSTQVRPMLLGSASLHDPGVAGTAGSGSPKVVRNRRDRAGQTAAPGPFEMVVALGEMTRPVPCP